MKGIGPQGLGRKGNNGYSIGSPAKFKAHKMFGKNGEVENAKTKEDHLSLKSKGYGHSPAKQKSEKGTLSINANLDKENKNSIMHVPKTTGSGSINYNNGRTNFSGSANTIGNYSLGMNSSSKSGRTNYNIGFNSNKGSNSVSAGVKFKL